MLYSDNTTGEIILQERTKRNWSQDKLAEEVGNICGNSNLTRQQIGRWEAGHPIKKLDELKALAKIFDCEIGYLLGEHTEKTRAVTDIKNETGLSYEAIVQLKKYLKGFPKELYIVNELLSSFPQLITAISDYFFLSDNIQTEFHIDTLNGQIAPKENYVFPIPCTELVLVESSHNLPINADLLRNALINSIEEKLILFKNNYVISIDDKNIINITKKAPGTN